MAFTSAVNQLLGILTILANAGVILIIVEALFPGAFPWLRRLVHMHAVKLAFIVVLVATLGSLTYSDIIGYEPCKLCWFQRIFMYPQVFLLGTALIKKEKIIVDYSLVLSALGGLIAGYHYLLQLGIAPALPCSAVGYSVSCSKQFVLQFGFISIPYMALSAFALIAGMFLMARLKKNQVVA